MIQPNSDVYLTHSASDWHGVGTGDFESFESEQAAIFKAQDELATLLNEPSQYDEFGLNEDSTIGFFFSYKCGYYSAGSGIRGEYGGGGRVSSSVYGNVTLLCQSDAYQAAKRRGIDPEIHQCYWNEAQDKWLVQR